MKKLVYYFHYIIIINIKYYLVSLIYINIDGKSMGNRSGYILFVDNLKKGYLIK